jgi:hypothetical protein
MKTEISRLKNSYWSQSERQPWQQPAQILKCAEEIAKASKSIVMLSALIRLLISSLRKSGNQPESFWEEWWLVSIVHS